MSVKTWKKEFYPKKPNKKLTWIEATEHSLRKWEGALKENLKKHNVVYDGHCIVNATELEDGSHYWERVNFEFNSMTCALCIKSTNAFDGHVDCFECPIYKINGTACDDEDDGIYTMSADNPKPMIKLLKNTLKKLQKKQNTA